MKTTFKLTLTSEQIEVIRISCLKVITNLEKQIGEPDKDPYKINDKIKEVEEILEQLPR